MKSYTVKQVAEQADVSEETVRRWIRSGKLEATQPSRKQGNTITEESLTRFAAASPTNAARLAGLIGGAIAIAPIAAVSPLGAATLAIATATKLLSGVHFSSNNSSELNESAKSLALALRDASEEADRLRASIKKKREMVDELTAQIREEQELVDKYDTLVRDANKRMLELITESKETSNG